MSRVEVGYKDEDEGYESDTAEEENSLRIKLLSPQTNLPTKGSRMAAAITYMQWKIFTYQQEDKY